MVEHKIDLIAEYCDEIIVMEQGHIICSGETKEILSRMELLDYDAQIPQVAIWGHEMAAAGKPLSEIPITVDQAVRVVQEREG